MRFWVFFFTAFLIYSKSILSNCVDEVIELSTKGSLSEYSLREYKSFEEEFIKTTTQTIQDFILDFREGIQTGNPHIRHLQDMGFEFSPIVRIPRLTKIMRYLSVMAEASMRESGLTVDEFILPALVAIPKEGKKGEKLLLSFGEEIPPGYTIVFNSFESTDGGFYGHLANGYLPMSLSTAGDGAQTSIFHDLNHMTAFIDFPEYAKFMRNMAKFVNSGERLSDFRLKSINRFHLSELLQLIPESKLDEMLSIGQLSNFFKSNTLTKNAARNLYSSLSTNEIDRILNQLLESVPGYMDILGGGARDVIAHENIVNSRFSPRSFSSFGNNISGTLKFLRSEVNGSKEAQVRELSIAITYFVGLSKLSLKDYLNSFRNGRVVQGSPLQAMLLETGLATEPRFASFNPSSSGPKLVFIVGRRKWYTFGAFGAFMLFAGSLFPTESK